MRKKTCIHAFVLLFLLLGVYSPVVFDSHLLKFDDPIVVAPMQKVQSLQGYLDLVKNKEIYDIQPVRDVSYWLNSTHAGNLFFWIVACFFVAACLLALDVPVRPAFFLGLLFSVNPLFVSSVAWLSARKHLLSFLFTISITFILIRQVKTKNPFSCAAAVGIVFLFLLAVFSQPINIMWPFFAAIYIYSKKDSLKFRLIPTAIATVLIVVIALSAAYLNQYYYVHVLTQVSQGTKYISEEYNTLFWRSWAWGRMFFQMIMPIQTPAADHYPYTYQSAVGLFLFVLVVLSLWKARIEEWWVWVLGAMLGVFPVLYRMTSIFAVDNYLLFSSFCIFILIGLSIKKYGVLLSGKYSIYIYISAYLLLVLFTYRSFTLAKAWNNDYALWEMSYQIEPSAKSAINFAGILSEKKQNIKAYEVAMESKKYLGKIYNSNEIIAKVIYLHPFFSNEQKISLLREDRNEWSLYYQAALKASEGDLKSACELMRQAIQCPNAFEFKDESIEIVAAENLFFCQTDTSRDQILLKSFKTIRRSKKWDDVVFEKRAKELGVLK